MFGSNPHAAGARRKVKNKTHSGAQQCAPLRMVGTAWCLAWAAVARMEHTMFYVLLIDDGETYGPLATYEAAEAVVNKLVEAWDADGTYVISTNTMHAAHAVPVPARFA
jgi:hypothetical protein